MYSRDDLKSEVIIDAAQNIGTFFASGTRGFAVYRNPEGAIMARGYWWFRDTEYFGPFETRAEAEKHAYACLFAIRSVRTPVKCR